MSEKEENEITVKVMCSKDELIKSLEKQGFKVNKLFSIDDYYYIPSSIDIQNMTTREILSKAIILRNIIDDGKIIQKITFKIKIIADNGDIINQKSVNCEVLNIEDAKQLFKSLGYYEIMNIKENDIVYCKNKFELAIKLIENSDILIEIETEPNTKWDSVEKIKTIISEIDIPIEKGQYFIKKAENELNKKLKR